MSKQRPLPPKLAKWLLAHVADDAIRYSALGEFEEQFYYIAHNEGIRRAKLFYWKQVFQSVPSFAWDRTYWSIAMFRNYLKVAIRNLFKHKTYSAINIFGLASGMACCLLILLFVQDEFSYDTFHEKADRIYRLTRRGTTGDNSYAGANTAPAMAPTLQQDYAAVEKVVRFYPLRSDVVLHSGDTRFQDGGFYFADKTVFEVFSFSLIRGNAKTALEEPYSVVLAEDIALKYFGDEDPIGKILSRESLDFKVTGVLKEIPDNSHFRFNFLASMSSLEDFGRNTFQGLGAWYNNLFYSYLLLEKGYDGASMKDELPGFVERYMGDTIERAMQSNVEFELDLQHLTDIHLRSASDLYSRIDIRGDMRYVYIFSAIAVFILFIACVNFMNLSTARSVHRNREVGMRKVLGAQRSQLVKQFLGESTVLSVISLLFAAGLVRMLLPFFNSVSGKALTMDIFKDETFAVIIPGIALLVGCAAGLYPAFFLSAFQPIKIMKGLSTTKAQGRTLLRKTLVVFQFAISIALIIATAVVGNQLAYLQNKKLGFDQEQLVVIHGLSGRTKRAYETVKRELLQHPNVLAVAAASGLPGQRLPADLFPVFAEGKEGENWLMRTTMVDHDFLETLDIELVAGRNFSREISTDLDEAFLVNETAVKALGWEDPIDKRLRWEAGGPNGTKQGRVIGVVKDFHFESLHQEIEPLVLHVKPDRFNSLVLRIGVENVPETLAFFADSWRKFDPEDPFKYSFLDEDFAGQYYAEVRLGDVFRYFSFLAIAIACLGLFGLVSFTAEQRTKEVGIRKVLGATQGNLVILLTKEFLQLVILANLIAWPIAYLAMNRWLQSFAYRADIATLVFLMAGILALAIAMLTVSFQAIKAAQANPVESLRYE